MEGHVLTAAAPALWNHEGNQNDAVYGLPEICLWLAVSAITHLGNTNGGSVEDGKLLVHAHACTCLTRGVMLFLQAVSCSEERLLQNDSVRRKR